MALAGSTPDDWDRLAGHLEEEPSVAGIELQLPQVADRSDAAAWIGAVRRATTLPVLVKLPTQRGSPLPPGAPAPVQMLWWSVRVRWRPVWRPAAP